jgi:4-aminobutyrate aminotransferase-like enzyme
MHEVYDGVNPDMVTFGKPAGNGYPLSGVIVKREIAERFSSMDGSYFNTFGGNTAAMAVSPCTPFLIFLRSG